MARLVLIETSTALCSVCLSENGKAAAYRQSSEPKAHASLTAVFVQEVLQEAGLGIRDCDAVCVSKGPGSYTGLRVGVSTAKGLCFGAGIPLLAVGTLDTLSAQAAAEMAGTLAVADEVATGSTSADARTQTAAGPAKYIVPMIDARRLEAYTAVFSPDGRQLTDTEAKIIDETSFARQLEEGPVLFIGDGAGKCREVLTDPNARFCQCCPKATSMIRLAEEAYNEKRFEDVAYFEPFYLKNFVATVSKKKLF